MKIDSLCAPRVVAIASAYHPAVTVPGRLGVLFNKEERCASQETALGLAKDALSRQTLNEETAGGSWVYTEDGILPPAEVALSVPAGKVLAAKRLSGAFDRLHTAEAKLRKAKADVAALRAEVAALCKS